MTDPVLFLLAVLTLLGTPGPTNTLLATSGAALGVRGSLPLLAAELAGYLIAIAVIRIVLGPVIEAWPAVGVALKVAVVLYLIWIAVRIWGHGNSPAGAASAISLRSVFLTTLLNPKALIFALSVIPQQHPVAIAYLAGFIVAVPAVGLGWILIGRAVGLATGAERAGTLRKVASIALVGFAGVVAASVLG